MSEEKPRLDLDWRTLMELVNAGISQATLWQVANTLDAAPSVLDDAEIAALSKMPAEYRQQATARLIDYAETIREASRNLDAQLLRLTGELV